MVIFLLLTNVQELKQTEHSKHFSSINMQQSYRQFLLTIKSENEIWCSTSLSTLRSSSADNRSSVIVLRYLFFINAIRLNERSPEQLETIKHMNMRSAMETNLSCSCSVCINLARSDGDEHPQHLAKLTKCTISSGIQQTADLHCRLRVCRTLC